MLIDVDQSHHVVVNLRRASDWEFRFVAQAALHILEIFHWNDNEPLRKAVEIVSAAMIQMNEREPRASSLKMHGTFQELSIFGMCIYCIVIFRIVIEFCSFFGHDVYSFSRARKSFNVGGLEKSRALWLTFPSKRFGLKQQKLLAVMRRSLLDIVRILS